MQAMASAATAAGGDEEDGIGIEKRESGSESQWTSQGFVRAPTPAVRLSDRPNRCCSKPVPDVFVAGCLVLGFRPTTTVLATLPPIDSGARQTSSKPATKVRWGPCWRAMAANVEVPAPSLQKSALSLLSRMQWAHGLHDTWHATLFALLHACAAASLTSLPTPGAAAASSYYRVEGGPMDAAFEFTTFCNQCPSLCMPRTPRRRREYGI